jgi:signal transduction histidine kinase
MKPQKTTAATILPLLMAFMCSVASPAVGSDVGSVRTPDAIRTDLEDASLSKLEERLKSIDAELPQLARMKMRNGAGSVGHSSKYYATADHTEWVQIDLGQPTAIDQIVLVPIICHDEKTGFTAKGFPAEFRILAGTEPGSQGTVIADFDEKDHLIPRTAPLVIPCKTTASWIRVEASLLSTRSLDNAYEFQLAEIMIFNVEKNVALNKPVTVSSTGKREGSTRKKEFLTDGFGPYQMAAGNGPRTIRFTSAHHIDEQPSVTIDLEDTYPLNRIFLHCSDMEDTIPQAIPNEYLLPVRMIAEGANQADFSDAVLLFEYHKNSIHDYGPIIMRHFPDTRCRYVRLTALELFNPGLIFPPALNFTEVEIFANGKNVALNKPVRSPPNSNPGSLLTDGSNTYGWILPLREWMTQLARRHELEMQRPLVAAELNLRYALQKTTLRRTIWIAAILALVAGLSVLINRMLRIRAILKIKEYLAADIHDELGANLQTIGMLSDLAQDAQTPEELNELLGRTRAFTDRSARSIRHCTNMLEARDCEDLAADMRRTATRHLADLDHDISIEGEELLKKITPRKRVDLFFFYKECLTNIMRHSGATRASTRLSLTPGKLSLSVNDNGSGMPCALPGSLKRRARLLGAKLSMVKPAGGGTCITLQLKLRKTRLFI